MSVARRGSGAAPRGRTTGGAGVGAPPPAPGETISLLADVLVTGLLTTVATLGVVTGYIAMVAGCSLLRERTAGDTGVGPRTYGRRLMTVARSGPAGLIVPPVAAVLLALDAISVHAGIPGARPLGVLLAVVTVVGVLLGMRAAGAWRPGKRWPELLRIAAESARHDLRGDLLLLMVAAAGTVLAFVVPMTLPLMPGLVALGITAVAARPMPDH